MSRELVSITAEILTRSKQAYADGWGFATVRDVSTHKDIKIVGPLDGIHEHMTVCVEGSWVKHVKYGMQIKVERIWEDDPRSEEGMVAWMTKRLPQIGPTRSKEIILHFGVDAMFEIIEKESTRLIEIKGITQERADEIVRAYDTYKQEQETFIGLYHLGFSKAETSRIMKTWNSPLNSIQEDPFILYGEVKGLTFRRLDEIRKGLELPENLPSRIQVALVDRAYRRCQERGHTVSDLYDFVIDVANWLDQNEEEVMEHLGDVVNAGGLAFFKGGVMLRSMDKDEQGISNRIKELLRVGQQRKEISRARENTEVDEAGNTVAEPTGDKQALANASTSNSPAAYGAAPGLNPDATAFSPAYWGAQRRGLFSAGRGSSSGQEHDVERADSGSDGGAGGRENGDPETDAG